MLNLQRENAIGVDDTNNVPYSLEELIMYELWHDVIERVKHSPAEARSKIVINLFGTHTKCHPLHALMKKKAVPLEVLVSLTEAYPEAVRSKTAPSNNLPIHIACRNGSSIEVIKHLVELFPESLTVPDTEGNLPIHIACWLSDEAVVKFLYSSSSEGAHALNKKQQTPLHMACNRYNVSANVVEMLLKENRMAALHQDWQGQLPLHKAITWEASLPTIAALLEAFPDAVRVYDRHSLTPYRICRKLVGLNSNDPTIKLMRSYRFRNGMLALRTRDVVQFSAEVVCDKIVRPSSRRPAARAA